MSENFDYFKENIKLFIALAPVSKTNNLDSKLYDLFDILQLDYVCQKLKFTEFLPFSKKAQKFTTWIFKKFPILSNLIIQILGDRNSSNINNLERMPVFVSHVPSGSSMKALNHLVQMYRKNKFCMYDYGYEKNFIKYGQSSPPEFDLKKIKDFPIALFSGGLDRLSHPNDVAWLADNLKETLIYWKKFDDMGHCSFQISKNIKWFDDGFKLIKDFSLI